MTTQASNVASNSSKITSGGILGTAGGGTSVGTAGAAGQVLMSDGTNWVSAAAPGGASTGDVVITYDNLSAPDYLPANDSIWLQSSYPALYASIGTLTPTVSDYTWNGVGPFGFSFYSVAYGAGIFVAGTSGGTVDTSPDGVTWTSRAVPVSTQINSIIFAAGKFVAVGDGGKIMTSSDGITWTERTSVGFTLADNITIATYGNGIFMIGGSGGVINTSPDGVTWTRKTNMSGTSAVVYLSFDGTQFVGSSGGNADMFFSSDGTSWSQIYVGFVPSVICCTPGKIVAVSFSSPAGIRVSINGGVTWTSATSNTLAGSTLNNARQIIYVGGQYFAVGSSMFATSSSGYEWKITNPFGASSDGNGISYGNGVFAAVIGSGGGGGKRYTTIGYDPTTQFITPAPNGYLLPAYYKAS